MKLSSIPLRAPAAPAPAVTLRTYALAAAAAFAWGGPPEGDGWEAGHLRACLDAVTGDDGDWTGIPSGLPGPPGGGGRPSPRPGPDLGLSLPEILAVALAAAVEEDLATGRLVAWLQAPLGRLAADPRPPRRLPGAVRAPARHRACSSTARPSAAAC